MTRGLTQRVNGLFQFFSSWNLSSIEAIMNGLQSLKLWRDRAHISDELRQFGRKGIGLRFCFSTRKLFGQFRLKRLLRKFNGLFTASHNGCVNTIYSTRSIRLWQHLHIPRVQRLDFPGEKRECSAHSGWQYPTGQPIRG